MEVRMVGHKMKEARVKKGYTQEQLAKKVNFSVPYISGIEGGRKIPRLKTFVRIANALEVNANYLLSSEQDSSDSFMVNEIYREVESLPLKDQIKVMKIMTSVVDNIK